MPDKSYIDIHVVDGGWHIDDGGQPELCSDEYSIAQDIKHSIMESGLARQLVAERNPIVRADVLLQMEQKAELDSRLVPGSASVTENQSGVIELSAQAYAIDAAIDTQVAL